MRFSYLFVVTFGRSGSTLLQGILNSFPRTLIRGENNNFLYGLYQSWRALEDRRYRHLKGEVRHPWFGYSAFSRRLFEEDIRRILDRFLLGTDDPNHYDCLGFKEVRYLDMKDRAEFLEFMLRVFPNSGIVLHHRAPEQASQSHWWKKADAQKTIKRMQDFIDFAAEFSRLHPQRTLITAHENIIGEERSDIARLCEFCGCRYNPKMIERILAVEHSVGNAPASARFDAED